MVRYVFTLDRELSEEQADALKAAVPGAWVKGQACGCAYSAGFLVERWLNAKGIGFRVRAPTVPAEGADLAKIPGLSPCVPGLNRPTLDIVLPYQADFIRKKGKSAAAFAWHAPGAGKTLSAILWACAVPGTTVVVTRAPARLHWAAEIGRYTTERVLILAGGYWIVAGHVYQPHVSVVAATGANTGALYASKAASTFAKQPRVWSPAELSPVGIREAEFRPQRMDKPDGKLAGYQFFPTGATRTTPMPKFIVLGWEGLPRWTQLLLALKPVSVVWDESHKGKGHKRFEALPEDTGTVVDVSAPANLPPGVKLEADAVDTDLFGDDALFDAGVETVSADELEKLKAQLREQTAAKSKGKVKFKRLENVVANAELLARASQRRLATTASPIKDRIRDFWGQLDLIDPGAFGGFYKFCDRYAGAHLNSWGGIDTRGRGGDEEIAELKQRISFYTHRVPYSVTHANLPAKRRQVIYLAPEQQCEVTGFYEEYRRAAKCGPGALLEVRLAEAAARKRPYVVEMALDYLREKCKVVIFTGRRKDCEILANEIGKAAKKLPTECLVVWGHGGTTTDARERIRAEYMDHPGPAILIGTGDAWGESINLHDTDLAIHAMLPPTPGQIIQREGRFSRQGQKRPVLNVYPIAEGTVEERLAELLIGKLPAVEDVVKLGDVEGFRNQLAYGGDEEKITQDMLSIVLGANTDEED